MSTFDSKSHRPTSCDATNLHQDSWEDSRVSFLLFLVLKQENVVSIMGLVKSSKEDCLETSINRKLPEGAKLAWRNYGHSGLGYMIDQNFTPRILHGVFLEPGFLSFFERTTLTFGVLED